MSHGIDQIVASLASLYELTQVSVATRVLSRVVSDYFKDATKLASSFSLAVSNRVLEVFVWQLLPQSMRTILVNQTLEALLWLISNSR